MVHRIRGFVYSECGVLLIVGMVYCILGVCELFCSVLLCVGMATVYWGVCVLRLLCAVVRRYGIPYVGSFEYCDCVVQLYVGMGYCILGGFVYCACDVLLCVGTGYCILGGLFNVTVVRCYASVWCTVYLGVCVL